MVELERDRQSQGRTRVGLMILLVGLLHLPSVFNPFFIDDYIYLDTVHDLSWSGIPGSTLPAQCILIIATGIPGCS